MKVYTFCHKCTMERQSPRIRIEGVLSLQEVNFYHFKCCKNHDNLVEIQAFKFELLFESGLHAIRDNYLMESVSSLTASLERFYEFFIRIKLLSNGFSSNDFNKIFKIIANQSERQYGAFLFLYGFSYNQNPPVLIDNKSIEFRNKIIHKGYLPSEDEVLKYAEDIFRVIRYYYIMLLKDHNKVIFDYLMEMHLQRRIENKDLIDSLNVCISNVAPNLALTHTLNTEDFQKVDLRKYYESIMSSDLYI